MQTQTFITDFAGKTLTAEITDLAGQANGSVIMRYGETVVLVTAVMSRSEQPNLPYFPLSVEFEEKFYAAGAILGSRFMRREGKPSDEAILSARIIDRTIRPLFNHQLRNDIQIVVSVLAVGEDDPDIIAVIGTSLALSISDIPWAGPVGVVRIARNLETGTLMINPTYPKRENGTLEFEVLACGQQGTINMIETAAQSAAEEDILAVLEAATLFHGPLEEWQRSIAAVVGKPKIIVPLRTVPDSLRTLFAEKFAANLRATLFSGITGKAHLLELKNYFLLAACELEEKVANNSAGDFFEEMLSDEIHTGAIERTERPDGRGLGQVRTLHATAGGVSPVLHGSGIFYRGETHMLSVLTLGGPESAQLIDTIEDQGASKRFMHHYNFPPFSVGETGRVGGFNRRMIGHGALAEKALMPVIPSQTDFPYTIRLVSETMSSNGSSSMGAVCASTLALMDGGVPITDMVAGIASGVMINEHGYALLTDIQGPEDEHGDMDFKVAGTATGITAMQMDVKVGGIPVAILGEALKQARVARLHILDTMKQTLRTPRSTISPRAPEIVSLTILPEQIGLVIGGGGKTINKIKSDTGVEEICIEENGAVFITGKNGSAKVAAEIIATLTKTYAVGDRVTVTVTKLATFGAFAKLDNYHEGLIHISEIAPFRIESLDGLLQVGEEVDVEVVKAADGKIGLSIKAINPTFASSRGAIE